MISIIIPTYNRARFLPRAIKSILNQTYQDWELIIVDDGSTDNTKEVVKKYLKDPRIKYIQTENLGAANARNVGVNKAKNNWVTFLDSDDEAYPYWIETWVGAINRQPGTGLISSGCDISKKNQIIAKKLPEKNSKLFGNLIYKITNGGSFGLKKELFKEIGGYDTNFKANQHTELAYRLIPYIQEHQIKTLAFDECLVKIHIHDGERIRNNWQAVFEGTIKIIDKHNNLLKKDPILLSNYYGVAANAAYRTGKNKKEILKLQWQAIKNKPFHLKSYLRLIKYTLL